MRIVDLFLEITHSIDRAGMKVSKPVVQDIIMREARTVASAFPRFSSEDVTLDTNGEVLVSALSNPGKIVEVHYNGTKLKQCAETTRQERMS